eukprot:UN05627
MRDINIIHKNINLKVFFLSNSVYKNEKNKTKKSIIVNKLSKNTYLPIIFFAQ